MRNRLIELIRNAPRTDTVYGDIKLSEPVQTLQTIADHLLAAGVIVPPCKVGDTVYYPLFNVGRVFEYKIVSIKLNSKGLYVVLDNRLRNEQMTHRASQVGKTIFLHKEEAEKALAERSKSDGYV